jgi:2-dehydropantoate 2-reductase
MTGKLRLLVVGCGAIGGVLAAALSGVAEVTGYDTNAAHVAAIRERGLEVTGAGPALLAWFEVTEDAATLAGRRFDAAIFLVKSGATAVAAAALGPALSGGPVLLSLQNGMGNAEALAHLPGLLARGVTMDAGRYLGPGRVERLIHGQPTWFGPVRGGPSAPLLPLAEVFRAAGLSTKVIPDPMGAVWAKFVFNAVMNPVGALLLGVSAARYEVAAVRDLIDEMAEECTSVVRALGGHFAFDPMGYVRKVRAGEVPLSRHAGSMALDIARGAPTEIEELTGFVVREAERLGIPAPACRTVYRLVKGLERAAADRAAEKGGQG